MKTTGIVRKTDGLGRVVLPAELRRTLGIEKTDSLEIFTDEDSIVLRKHRPGCIFCGNTESITYFNKTPVCFNCAKTIADNIRTG